MLQSLSFKTISTSMVSGMCLLMIIFYGLFPVGALAETAPPADTTTSQAPLTTTPPSDTPPAQPSSTDTNISTPAPKITSPGPKKPTGAAANTYAFNKVTGLWENDHYTWDPNTGQTAPKDAVNYSYNPSTGMWDTTQWIYDAAAGKYEANVVSAQDVPVSQQSAKTAQDVTTSPSEAQTNNIDTTQQAPASPPAAGAMLMGSNAKPNLGSSNNGTFDLFYNASISNNISSSASSGDASVANNTTGGNATTGNAQSIANVLNLLNSVWGLSSGNAIPFIANIAGNVVGDIFIDPSQIQHVAPATPGGSITINAQNNGTINNTISLDASTGNAAVLGNTTAGNATTGNAQAMANVMNVINTSIGSGQSFIGMLNIYGNLNGDILLPPGMLNSLLADNSTATPLSQNNNTATKSVANLTDNQTIVNQISTTATSGGANVTGNTTAGNATTGNASTNVALFNLTGKQVIGKNALLVFVNVLGKWVGMIMNAPGTTAGLIGGNTTASNIPATNVSTNINAINNSAITNNITASAASGNANVTNNTTGGNAASGNANVGVNVLNLANSTFSLSDWFGILFINVLGNWYGSFGVNTDAGNPVAVANANTADSNGSSPQVFSFSRRPSTSASYASTTATTEVRDSNQNDNTVVLGAETSATPPPSNDANTIIGNIKKFNWPLALIGPILALLWLAGSRIAALRQGQSF